MMATKTLDEIHDMIQTAFPGDGDRLLDICQALLERLRDAEQRIEVLNNGKADRPYDPKERF
jgi:hypothetical protein